jgi:lipoyl(octanoyl) transferase
MNEAVLRVWRYRQLISHQAAYEDQMRHWAELERAAEREARLLLLQHTPIYTLGRATRPEHLPTSEENLAGSLGVPARRCDRGGSITYHGPGQITGYLLLNLKTWDISVHQHLWNIEEIIIRALALLGLRGERAAGMTGIWCVPREEPEPRVLAKVCAIGTGCRRWVTFHGFGLNVDLDLAPFSRIDPCGLGRRPVTSLAKLLCRAVPPAGVEAAVVKGTADVLGATRVAEMEV